MKKHCIFYMAMTSLLMTSIVFGADIKVNRTGFPIVNKKITLKGFARLDPQHGPYDEMTLWKDYEKLTNIHIEWDTPGKKNYKERKNLVLASGDLPDFFMKGVLTVGDVVKYGTYGALIPLENLIDQHAPNLKKILDEYPEIRKNITAPDGHIYSLPRIVNSPSSQVWRNPLLNMTWIKRLGLKVPKTSDEFLNMLRTFRDKDPNGNGNPNDEIPFTSHNYRWVLRSIAPMFGVKYDVGGFYQNDLYPMSVKNGKVHIQNADPAFKKAMQYFAKMYQENLVDHEVFTHTAKDYFAKLAAGRVGFTPLSQPANAGKYANDYDAIVPPKGPVGHQAWTFVNSNLSKVSTVSITNANKYPEATMRWFDHFYGDEGATKLYLVKEGEFYTVDKNGKYHLHDKILHADIGMEKYMGKHTIFPGGGAHGYYTDKQLIPINEGSLKLTYLPKIKPYLTKKVYNVPMRSLKDQELEDEIRADLDIYVTEMWAKFVAGEVSFDKWDKYAATMKKMGLRKLENIIQKAIFGK